MSHGESDEVPVPYTHRRNLKALPKHAIYYTGIRVVHCLALKPNAPPPPPRHPLPHHQPETQTANELQIPDISHWALCPKPGNSYLK